MHLRAVAAQVLNLNNEANCLQQYNLAPSIPYTEDFTTRAPLLCRCSTCSNGFRKSPNSPALILVRPAECSVCAWRAHSVRERTCSNHANATSIFCKSMPSCGSSRLGMHACMHAYMHAYMQTYIHTHIHIYIHACIHTYTRVHHTCMHTYIHTYIHPSIIL